MITVIIGFTGQGKSTLAYNVASRCDTRVIIDPRKQFSTVSDTLPDATELYDLLDVRSEVIVQPGRGGGLGDIFAATCKAVADWIEDNPLERICVLADEGRLLGLYSRDVNPDFDWILRSAREGSPIDVIITCHRPVDVHTNIRAIANRIVLFRVTLPNDLEAIEEQCGPVVAEEVLKLLDRQYIVWNNSRQQWRKVYDPSTWYVKIAEAPTVGYSS
jgi:hypothetical protein